MRSIGSLWVMLSLCVPSLAGADIFEELSSKNALILTPSFNTHVLKTEADDSFGADQTRRMVVSRFLGDALEGHSHLPYAEEGFIAVKDILRITLDYKVDISTVVAVVEVALGKTGSQRTHIEYKLKSGKDGPSRPDRIVLFSYFERQGARAGRMRSREEKPAHASERSTYQKLFSSGVTLSMGSGLSEQVLKIQEQVTGDSEGKRREQEAMLDGIISRAVNATPAIRTAELEALSIDYKEGYIHIVFTLKNGQKQKVRYGYNGNWTQWSPQAELATTSTQSLEEKATRAVAQALVGAWLGIQFEAVSLEPIAGSAISHLQLSEENKSQEQLDLAILFCELAAQMAQGNSVQDFDGAATFLKNYVTNRTALQAAPANLADKIGTAAARYLQDVIFSSPSVISRIQKAAETLIKNGQPLYHGEVVRILSPVDVHPSTTLNESWSFLAKTLRAEASLDLRSPSPGLISPFCSIPGPFPIKQ